MKFGIEIVCDGLDHWTSCKTETGSTVLLETLVLADCQLACEAHSSKGRLGCCQYQTDHRKCMFVPGEITLENNGAARYASICAGQGL